MGHITLIDLMSFCCSCLRLRNELIPKPCSIFYSSPHPMLLWKRNFVIIQADSCLIYKEAEFYKIQIPNPRSWGQEVCFSDDGHFKQGPCHCKPTVCWRFLSESPLLMGSAQIHKAFFFFFFCAFSIVLYNLTCPCSFPEHYHYLCTLQSCGG